MATNKCYEVCSAKIHRGRNKRLQGLAHCNPVQRTSVPGKFALARFLLASPSPAWINAQKNNLGHLSRCSVSQCVLSVSQCVPVCPSEPQCVLSVAQCVAVCLKCVAVQKRNLAGFNGQKQSCFSPLALTCVSRLIKLLQYFIWQMHMIVFLLLMVMIVIVMMIMIQDGPPV